MKRVQDGVIDDTTDQFDWEAYEVDPKATGGNDRQFLFAMPNGAIGITYGKSDDQESTILAMRNSLRDMVERQKLELNSGGNDSLLPGRRVGHGIE